jgi:hypothetical protein
MREGNQNDKIDARRLAELLRLNHLSPVYHGDHGLRSLKEWVRSYLTITKDLGRVMSRVKAIYRTWGIPCSGSLSVSDRVRSISGYFSGGGRWVLETLWFESESQLVS